jgi:hypothetical protein
MAPSVTETGANDQQRSCVGRGRGAGKMSRTWQRVNITFPRHASSSRETYGTGGEGGRGNKFPHYRRTKCQLFFFSFSGFRLYSGPAAAALVCNKSTHTRTFSSAIAGHEEKVWIIQRRWEEESSLLPVQCIAILVPWWRWWCRRWWRNFITRPQNPAA